MTIYGFNVLNASELAPPSREDVFRAYDRTRVRTARGQRRHWVLLALLVGPGILTMLGENDGPSMLSYVTTGATYGVGWFVPFVVLTFAMAYVVQEAAVRIGVATQRGHAELIFERYGKAWGYFSMVDLTLGNVMTIVAEFISIRAGSAFFGVPAPISIGVAALVVLAAFATRRYFTWERFVLLLALGNLMFVPIAFLAYRPGVTMSATFGAPSLHGGSALTLLTLLLANVGATVTPWMIFFQQSATVDKGLVAADLRHGRLDTALGAILAAVVAVATLVVGATLFVHHIPVGSLATGTDFAGAIQPYVGRIGSTLFAVGMIEAGLVAAITISASSSYASGEVSRTGGSLNRTFAGAWMFYGTGVASIVVAASIVLIPHAPLLAITIAVNVIATVLMAPALCFLLLLANDPHLMGSLRNGVIGNVAAGCTIGIIAILGFVYGVIVVFPEVFARL